MSILLSKNLKQKQNVTLTPSLKKSIDLLQLSRFELIKKIEREIDENPFLQKEKDTSEIEGSYSQDFDFDFESKVTLHESLIKQLVDFDLNKKQIELSTIIIGCIDENGMLVDEIDEIEELSNHIFNRNEIEEMLENVIQKMSPCGVGYRNHKECIEIQLRNKNISKKTLKICMLIILNESMDDLDKIQMDFIENGGTIESFESALKEIKKCDLSPGLNFEESKYIYPDLKIVVENNNSKIKFINNDFPKIKIDEDLTKNIKKDLKKNKNSEISEKISEARWLLSSVKKRNDTVLKVGEYIFSKQINFFKNNPIKIETLTNKEISEELGLHPSTVSRILKNKYIDTPKGIMPLKSLMVSSVSKSRNITSIQLMNLIKDIIKHENKPKSDKQITIELNKRGFNLARRTITKYRKRNNIPSSRDR